MATLTQLPDVVDLSFVAGDTFRIRVRVTNPNEVEPEPLAGYEFCAQIVKDSDRSPAADFEIEPDPDSPLDAVRLTLPPSETAPLPGLGDGKEFKGVWDLEVKFPSGDVRTVVKGSVTCVLDVSTCPTP